MPHVMVSVAGIAIKLNRLYLFIIWSDTSSFQLRSSHFRALLDVSCRVG